MSISPFTIKKQPAVQVTISAEPIYSILLTLALLTTDVSTEAVEPWLMETAKRLSPEEQQRNRLVFDGLGAALLPEINYIDFPAYLAALATQPAEVLQGRISTATFDSPIADPARGEFETELPALLATPEAMQLLLVNHLTAMWETYLAPEWEKQQSNLRSMVTLLSQREFGKGSASETIRTFIRRDIPDEIGVQLAGIKQVIFVPTPHIRLYANRFGHSDKIWVFVLANFWSLPLRDEPIKRGEVLGPLRALADDTRLQILEHLASQNELLAQEVIARLDIGQSTVSRHLKQLVAAQIVMEEKGPDANKLYRLNPKSIEQLYHTLTTLFSAENANTIVNDVRLTLPPTLRRFLDRNGKITVWPRKYKDKLILMHYLIEKFELRKDYTESEVNDLLADWHTNIDEATLRRALFDAGLLGREGNGSKYWRAEVLEA